ncbi:uncharacterized protein E0L32_000563 [Thyridium curvatum]|uniref:Sodium/calcium exchanger membrane region domain-containing protein n=1 Tax=Thyridium curvatum TaxID=1093900 RepID=A0A507B9U9_9PEZI|nr:uncharacterized protein E0L32_000563 [Thyridium curvatum]TPX14169.1 hypothetical protein E0L32_000563 [Thyridium curvatum]
MPAPKSSRRARYSSRPFLISTCIITLLAAYSIFLRPHLSAAVDTAPPLLRPRSTNEECRLVHQAQDKCAFVRENCGDEEAGLLSYLTFYYCTLGKARPVAFVFLVSWLGLLFTTIGIAASDFFSVNLSTIASILGLSESLAGVTFLAFGNGSPDVFSTFAAMGSNSGSMAVGELIGAAGFITSVVAGSMALVREFKVSKKTFVRDICFFIVSVSFAMVFLADGELHLWECCVMIGFYVFYVVVVVGWHWLATRRRRRREKEAASRSHFYNVDGEGADALEPYQDEPDEDDTTPMGRRQSAAAEDISALERGPRIEINDGDGAQDEEEEDERERHVAAEMTSSMRVNRPRGRRSNTTITPIRPSLVGVLEFRSILSSLQKSGNVHLGPVHSRSHSEYRVDPAAPLDRSALSLGSVAEGELYPPTDTHTGRDRALSSGDMPLNLPHDGRAPPTLATYNLGIGDSTASGLSPAALSPRDTSQIAGHDHQQGSHLLPGAPFQHPKDIAPSPSPLSLQIPSPATQSPHSSPSLSPFPGLSESPLPITPSVHPHGRTQSFMLPTPDVGNQAPFFGDAAVHKPVRWWPYNILPPPHVLMSTIFPTLQGWKEKSIWDKFISIVSVPSIFLLVTTLPVVEAEADDDDESSEDAIVDPPERGEPGAMAPPISIEEDASLQPETEWQRYRRSTRSASTAASLRSSSPHAATDGVRVSLAGGSSERQPLLVEQPSKPTPTAPSDIGTGEAEPGWNRWLVVLQVFTGPLFTVFIVWANMMENLEHPKMTLFKLVLCSLVGSLVVLAFLLAATSPDRKPKYHFLLCFLGFIISIAWISTVAGEVVGVLKAFGVILGISEAILGLTIFAVGNSVGDLVADITVARLGYPVMALSACFGGPLLNILLGVGLGGAWMTLQSANHKHEKHPKKPLHYKPYHIQVGGTLMISAVTVLVTLVFLLVIVPTNKWIMTRKIGLSLIVIWTVSTIINVVVEMTGLWAAVD